MASRQSIVSRTSVTRAGLSALLLLLLAGCASAPDDGGIFVPVGGGQAASTAESGQESSRDQEPVSEAGDANDTNTEQPRATSSSDTPESDEKTTRPSHREQAQVISPAAASLVKQADKAFRSGNIDSGLAALQRAQRISPDAAVIYYKMAEGYVRNDNLARAEQFARKGVSLAGTDHRLQKSGWQLLSDIRRAQGNVAGAEAAESRASSL